MWKIFKSKLSFLILHSATLLHSFILCFKVKFSQLFQTWAIRPLEAADIVFFADALLKYLNGIHQPMKALVSSDFSVVIIMVKFYYVIKENVHINNDVSHLIESGLISFFSLQAGRPHIELFQKGKSSYRAQLFHYLWQFTVRICKSIIKVCTVSCNQSLHVLCVPKTGQVSSVG